MRLWYFSREHFSVWCVSLSIGNIPTWCLRLRLHVQPEVMTPWAAEAPAGCRAAQMSGLQLLSDGDTFHAVPPTRRGIVPAFQKCFPSKKESERRGGTQRASSMADSSGELPVTQISRKVAFSRMMDPWRHQDVWSAGSWLTAMETDWITPATFHGRRLLLILITGEAAWWWK